MTPLTRLILAVLPLASYFFVLCFLHGGKKPRVVSGPLDLALLCAGLGGLVAFGPFGDAMLARLVGARPSLLAWLIWLGLVVLWSIVLSLSAGLRLAVYNLTADDLRRAVADALNRIPGRFQGTLHGFEDTGRGVGLIVKPVGWLRSGGIVAYGRDPEVLIRQLAPQLKSSLASVPRQASWLPQAMFAVACVTAVIPFWTMLMANPHTKDTLRAWMQALRIW